MRGKLGKDPEHQKTKATKYEKQLAKDLGGQAVVGSGAFDFAKGDVKARGILWDSKQTAKAGIYLSSTVLSKITREAVEEGCIPGIIATLETVPFGTAKAWGIIPLMVLNEMLAELQQLREK